MTSVLLILAVAYLGHAEMSVYNLEGLLHVNNPQKLRNISYSIANFGFAPIGKSLISHLTTMKDDLELCSEHNDHHLDNPSNLEDTFILINRGKCEFVTKALNAQKMGATLAIIMDNQTHSRDIIMKDNGLGYRVKIPTVFIHHEDGQTLSELMKSNDRSVIMRVAFEVKKTEKVTVVFYMEATKRNSYRLVREFKPFYQKISEYIDFKLVYLADVCHRCQEPDCYYAGEYCSMNYILEEGINGRMVLDQQIREQIVYKLYTNKWWDYMDQIDIQCSKINQLEECGNEIMQKLQISSNEVNKAFEASFLANGDNSYLKASAQDLKSSGVKVFPSVSINNVKMRGRATGEYIFDDVCNTLLSPPTVCNKYLGEAKTVTVAKDNSVLIIISIIVGIVLCSIMFLLYKRLMRKKMTGQMQSRIDDMVSKYIQFYSERRPGEKQ